jgi:hypothetical protein
MAGNDEEQQAIVNKFRQASVLSSSFFNHP